MTSPLGSATGLPALSVRRPYLATVLNLLIIVAGVAAILGVEVRELPDVDRPIVTVRANYPGASPETVDAEVTSVVEAAVARINGVVEVRSSSEENNFRIRIVFRPSVDLISAANDVREAVSRVERELPEGVEDLFVIKADADARGIIQIAVSSQVLSIEEVTRRVERDIIPELTSVDGVANVEVFGKRQRVLRVRIDPMRLAGYKLSVNDVAKVLHNARYDVPAGSFKSDQQEVIVRANASVTTPRAIEKLIIRDNIRLGDVAHAFFGPEDAESYVRLNGRTVLKLSIVRRARSNTVAISRDVALVVKQLNTRFKELNIVTTSDDALFIKGAIREVLITLGLAILIVVSVVAVFVGQFRAALIPAVAIPVALTGTIAAIWAMGFSVNLVTLLALVLATGLVVDDAIVVLENIQRQKAKGMAPAAAAVIGARQVFFAVIATTVTLVSVFTPISFLPTTAGKLFGEFGFVLAVAVMISSFVALTLCPMLAARLPDKEAGRFNLLTHTAFPLGRTLRSIYARIIDRVLAAPLIILGLCAIIAVGGGIAYRSLGEELVPKEDRGLLTIRMVGPDGVGLNYTDRQVERVEAILSPLLADGTITSVATVSGWYDLNRGFVEAQLRDWSTRTVGEGELARRVNRKMSQIPGVRGRVRRSNSLGLRNTGAGIRFALTGGNYDRIWDAADDFVQAIEQKIPNIRRLRIEFRATQPQISVSINRRRASDLGVSLIDLAATVKALVDNDKVGELTIDDQTVPIILQALSGAVDDPSDLNNLYVNAAGGRLVPLSQLVSFKEKAVAAELDRHSQRRAIEIFADIADDFSLRHAVDALRELADETLPKGIGLIFLDEASTLDETSRGMIWTYCIALIIVFLILVAQFEGITSALVVVLTVPFGICAAVFALALTGTTINIYSQIGVLMLIGIMAKNAILMVEFADQLRETGAGVLKAAREASLVRLRPITMTMVSTVLAGLPLILGSGPGVESRAAIGWVVFGGLGLAAIITLFLTPALYVLLSPLSKPRNLATQKLAEDLATSES